MTPEQWKRLFAEVSAELARLAEGKENPDEDLSPREIELLEELERLGSDGLLR